ncbi:MAG: type VI secretion system lipoprotein TssJ [Cellvibrionaceae bacterium]|nr:type VI secretion system lipoprotein TssJ [Cellvibrionaceae bacterium]
MMKILLIFRWLLISFSLGLVLGCQPTRRVLNFDTSVELQFSTSNMVNPDRDGRASPVIVRVYKLADERQFSREDFLNLYEDADNRLGKDLLGTVVLKELAPGESRKERIELEPKVKYVGLLAEFIRYQDAQSIQLVSIVDHKTTKVSVSLSGTQLRVKKL